MPELVFLKLGGSLITDKTRPYTPRLDVLADLASQIAATRMRTPDLRLLLGHGSGSFGHTAAREYRTREGFPGATPIGRETMGEGGYWHGFAEVAYQAAALNRLVMEALQVAEVPAMTFPPSAGMIARDGRVAVWNLAPLRAALEAGLLPVIYGDAVFDQQLGGTILSTEELMAYLAHQLHPTHILLAGLEAGVWEDFSIRERLFNEITPGSLAAIRQKIGPARGADVTGGMLAKVEQMLSLVQEVPGLRVQIFSGETGQNLERVLGGEILGTLIHA
jgi:isopentenyl phosphate kinase